MTLNLTDDQRMFQDTVRAFLRERYEWDLRKAAIETLPGWRPEIWTALSDELGALGLGFDEEDGGLGGGGMDHLAVMAPLGEFLVVEPYSESVVFAGSLLRASRNPAAKALIAELIAGRALPVVAAAEGFETLDLTRPVCEAGKVGDGFALSGAKVMVPAAPWATHFLVTAQVAGGAGVAVFVVPRETPGLTRRDVSTIDGRRASDLVLSGVAVSADALILEAQQAVEAIDYAVDAMTVAVCGEAVGVLDALVSQTVAYTLERRQFGKPLADFQALQHRMADMKVALEQARAITLLAATNLEAGPARRRAAVSASKVQVNKAGRLIGQSAVQLHGGMGMTMELPIGHYFRRLTVIERTFGSTDDHLVRFAQTADHHLI